MFNRGFLNELRRKAVRRRVDAHEVEEAPWFPQDPHSCRRQDEADRRHRGDGRENRRRQGAGAAG